MALNVKVQRNSQVKIAASSRNKNTCINLNVLHKANSIKNQFLTNINFGIGLGTLSPCISGMVSKMFVSKNDETSVRVNKLFTHIFNCLEDLKIIYF